MAAFNVQFLHGGWLHIIGNMWTLWIFGDNVEDRMGSLRFAIFYVTCGMAAVAQLITLPDSMVPTVGASGAIAGVLGAYLLFFPTARLVVLFPVLFLPFFFQLPAVLYLGAWFVIQLFSGTLALASAAQVGGIAWWAHVGGFTAGLLLCRLFVRRRRALRMQTDEYAIEWTWQLRRWSRRRMKMAVNLKLTRAIKDSVVQNFQLNASVLLINFVDGSKMTVTIAECNSPPLQEGARIRQIPRIRRSFYLSVKTTALST